MTPTNAAVHPHVTRYLQRPVDVCLSCAKLHRDCYCSVCSICGRVGGHMVTHWHGPADIAVQVTQCADGLGCDEPIDLLFP